jgi:hypothetical protein
MDVYLPSVVPEGEAEAKIAAAAAENGALFEDTRLMHPKEPNKQLSSHYLITALSPIFFTLHDGNGNPSRPN